MHRTTLEYTILLSLAALDVLLVIHSAMADAKLREELAPRQPDVECVQCLLEVELEPEPVSDLYGIPEWAESESMRQIYREHNERMRLHYDKHERDMKAIHDKYESEEDYVPRPNPYGQRSWL